MMDYLNLSRAIANGHAAETIPPWSANVLRAIIEGRRTLRAAVHPLGFTCLPVIREGRYGVCVHAWLPGQQVARPTTSAVHAHSWDLVSYVLIGRLRNELPDVTGAQPGAVGAWQVLEVRSRGDTDVIVPTRRLVHCQAGESALHVQDDVYTVPAGTFHSSIADSAEPTVTIVLGSASSGGADLSLGSPGTRTHRVHRRRRAQAETAALARTIIDLYWRLR
jgi:hypothetical protein